MDFIKKFLSRKLIVVVAGAVYFIGNGDVNQAVALILGYIAVEGGIDLAKTIKTKA